jgi:hypothetical protein
MERKRERKRESKKEKLESKHPYSVRIEFGSLLSFGSGMNLNLSGNDYLRILSLTTYIQSLILSSQVAVSIVDCIQQANEEMYGNSDKNEKYLFLSLTYILVNLFMLFL